MQPEHGRPGPAVCAIHRLRRRPPRAQRQVSVAVVVHSPNQTIARGRYWKLVVTGGIRRPFRPLRVTGPCGVDKSYGKSLPLVVGTRRGRRPGHFVVRCAAECRSPPHEATHARNVALLACLKPSASGDIDCGVRCRQISTALEASPAPAGPNFSQNSVVRALVLTICHTVPVGVIITDSAATLARVCLALVRGASVLAIDGAVGVRVHVRNAATTQPFLCFCGITWATILAIKRPIRISISVRHSAPTDTRGNLAGILWAHVVAIGNAVLIGIRIRHRAAAQPWHLLRGIRRAQIVAVRRAIQVGVSLREPTTALACFGLLRILLADVNAISHPVAIAVNVSHSTTAHVALCLGSVRRTTVVTIRRAIVVCVRISDPAATQAR
mmetsp:Transcript_12718/g.28217  ORF Transcript_12718/g.28217 Transcript_12718/m.28217 type:complete len:384 (-) Transcript_12718:69-1220(-)